MATVRRPFATILVMPRGSSHFWRSEKLFSRRPRHPTLIASCGRSCTNMGASMVTRPDGLSIGSVSGDHQFVRSFVWPKDSGHRPRLPH
jgi:hypothetical protein